MLSRCTSCLPVALPATHPSPLHLLPRGRSSNHTSIIAELSELKRVMEELKNSESEKLEKIDVIKKERNLLLERLNEAEEKLKESEIQIREFERKIEGFETRESNQKLKESEIQISSVVEAIKKRDVSYNELSGTLPFWVNESNFQLIELSPKEFPLLWWVPKI